MSKFECIYVPGSSVDVVSSGTNIEGVGLETIAGVDWSIPTLQNNSLWFCDESTNKIMR